MTTTFTEGFVQFEFSSEWSIIKWDGEPIYRQGIGKLDNTRAIDFVGLLWHEPWLIEVKDFRDHRIENKAKLIPGIFQSSSASS